ncbi:MAG: hypothetical protein H6741_15435 [Alphaproteobacteria bacterium]|nr:hypothetical protein [Alphaproteobacteria bacterium]MCB9794107.1 hypothetical protein [Alphaproteobacteria bacterium]
MDLSSLSALPEGVAEALGLIDGLDECLLLGFARLGPDQKDALRALDAAFTGTPLSAALAEAVAAATSGQAIAQHLLTLAAARASLHGAAHDALYAQAVAAMGLSAQEQPAPAAPTLPEDLGPLLDSLRQWLLELVLAGLANVDADAILPFMATLEKLRERPELARLSALLTGFVDELLASLPVAKLEVLPRKRWADLWSRCMLGTTGLGGDAGVAVSGSLSVAGVELRHHDHAVSAVLHGWLETSEGGQWARATVSAWKADAVTGSETLALLARQHKEVFEALAADEALGLKEARLLPSGDLVLGPVTSAAAADPIEVTEKALAAGVAARPLGPADRHPALLGLPVLLDEVQIDAGKVSVGDHSLPLATHRLSPLAGIDADKLSRVRRAFGLLRFDDGAWEFQPLLCEEGGKKAKRHGPDLAGAVKARTPTFDTLQGKAKLLLRAKS